MHIDGIGETEPRWALECRMLALSSAVTTWLLSLVALVVGSVGTYALGLLADRRRLSAEDDRRWLNDRRALYSRYLGLLEQLERDADSIACFLPHDEGSPPMEAEDESLVLEMSFEWMARWEGELQPALSEIDLMATPRVADRAARAAHALLEAVPQAQIAGPRTLVTPSNYRTHWPVHQAARDLCEVVRNEMRAELGLDIVVNQAAHDPSWPYLAERPSIEEHRQRMNPYLYPEDRRDADECSESGAAAE